METLDMKHNLFPFTAPNCTASLHEGQTAHRTRRPTKSAEARLENHLGGKDCNHFHRSHKGLYFALLLNCSFSPLFSLFRKVSQH